MCGATYDNCPSFQRHWRARNHHVRCVKPNDFHFTPIDGRAAFDAYKTYRQLLYAGNGSRKDQEDGLSFQRNPRVVLDESMFEKSILSFVDGVDE